MILQIIFAQFSGPGVVEKLFNNNPDQKKPEAPPPPPVPKANVKFDDFGPGLGIAQEAFNKRPEGPIKFLPKLTEISEDEPKVDKFIKHPPIIFNSAIRCHQQKNNQSFNEIDYYKMSFFFNSTSK